MNHNSTSIRKDRLDRANDLIERLSSDGVGAQLFPTEFKDRFIEEVRASDMFRRSETTQDATEAIIAVFDRIMMQLHVEDSIKAPIRSAFVLQLISAS